MPVGYLVTVVLVAVCTAVTVVPLRRPPVLAAMSFRVGLVVNELPFVAFCFLLASTVLVFGQGDVDSPGAWAAVSLAALTGVWLAVIAWRGLRAAPVVDQALDGALGAGWRAGTGPLVAGRRRIAYARILFRPPLVFGRRDVRRRANIRYGDAGRRNLLDVYQHRAGSSGAPVLIHLHGGHFRGGHKNSQSLPLIYRLASQGWVCVSANYRLRPAARFPDHLVDVKKVIAWVRAHGREYGADPSVIFVAGSSAGAHLAAMAALTPNDPAFQPGFPQCDTSVTAAVCLNGYYGPISGGGCGLPSSPLAYVGADAPPVFVAHGDADTVVPAEDARRFVDTLRSASSSPVVYVKLPGGQHAFDLFHSLRFEAVIDGIEAFAAWVRARGTIPTA